LQAARIEQQQVKETEREQVHAKERQWKSEREWEWEQQPQNARKRDERKQAQWNERD
jgi:hypothetical protein